MSVSRSRQLSRSIPQRNAPPSTGQNISPMPSARSLAVHQSASSRVAQVPGSSDAARRPVRGSYGTFVSRPALVSCRQPTQIGRPPRAASVRAAGLAGRALEAGSSARRRSARFGRPGVFNPFALVTPRGATRAWSSSLATGLRRLPRARVFRRYPGRPALQPRAHVAAHVLDAAARDALEGGAVSLDTANLQKL